MKLKDLINMETLGWSSQPLQYCPKTNSMGNYQVTENDPGCEGVKGYSQCFNCTGWKLQHIRKVYKQFQKEHSSPETALEIKLTK